MNLVTHSSVSNITPYSECQSRSSSSARDCRSRENEKTNTIFTPLPGQFPQYLHVQCRTVQMHAPPVSSGWRSRHTSRRSPHRQRVNFWGEWEDANVADETRDPVLSGLLSLLNTIFRFGKYWSNGPDPRFTIGSKGLVYSRPEARARSTSQLSKS